MAKLGERIRKIRKLKNISQVQLENKTGIKREYLSKIENSELKNPTYNTLRKICTVLGISLTELVQTEEEPQLRKAPSLTVLTDTENALPVGENIAAETYTTIPLVSHEVAARGVGHIDVREIEQYILLSTGYLDATKDNSRFRCVRISADDNSMSPLLEPGSIVIIDSYETDPLKLDEKLVLLRNGDESCIIRQIRLQANHVVLLPQNLKEYSPQVISIGRKSQVLGKLVCCLRKF